MLRLVLFTIITIIQHQMSLTYGQDLKSIFHTPTRRNYDDFEILERAGFGRSDVSTPTPISSTTSDTPKAYANAQVLLRFGEDNQNNKCKCGDVCQCRGAIPYIIPILTPIPYCLPPPPPPPSTITEKPTEAPQNENIVKETPQKCEEIKNDNHPEILNSVELSNDIIQTLAEKPNIDQIKCLEEVSNKLEPKEASPNVKLVSMDLSKLTPSATKSDLDDCLVTYSSPKHKPKHLLTYPIFNRPRDEVLMPVRPPQVGRYSSGYNLSGASGYYSDPAKTVIYKRPTILTIIGPPRNFGSDNSVKYVLVPVTKATTSSPTIQDHCEDCCCCSCAKYVGELNEKTA